MILRLIIFPQLESIYSVRPRSQLRSGGSSQRDLGHPPDTRLNRYNTLKGACSDAGREAPNGIAPEGRDLLEPLIA